jgi:uncharacterized membrane protein YfcA
LGIPEIVLGLGGLLIGIMKAGFGGGIGVVVTPLLALVMPAKLALGAILPLSVAADLISVRYYWRYRVIHHVIALLPGMVVGVGVGWLLLDAIPEALFRKVLGALACVFAILQTVRERLPDRVGAPGRGFALVAGVALGTVSVLAHSGGIVLMLYLMPQRLSGRAYVSTAILVGIVLNVLKIVPYRAMGLLGGDVLQMDLWMLPAVAVGTGVGILVNKRLSPVWFNRAILVLVVAIGINLMIS